jgi:N6-adenosine-specific RNA methylase IME4
MAPAHIAGLASADEAFAGWSARITRRWLQTVQQTVESFLEIGRLLIEAKHGLEHGEFEAMIEDQLPFKPRTARRLMAIARDQRIANRTRGSVLPVSWTTLYELTKLDDQSFEAAVADRAIKPDMERGEAAALVRQVQRAPAERAYADRLARGCKITDLEDHAASGARYGVIYADPPWEFKAYSGKGKDRSAERHYSTRGLDAIKALPVAALAADDCALLMWAVMPELPGALDVIAAWGFEYKTAGFAWVKQNRSGEGLFWGMGYWTRANAEVCLLATKGNPKRLNADVHQVVMAPVAQHSSKPDEVHARIERLVGGPYLELYARRERAGWTTWGDEIPRDEFAAGLKQRMAAIVNAPVRPIDGDDDLDIPPFFRRGDPACPFGRVSP